MVNKKYASFIISSFLVVANCGGEKNTTPPNTFFQDSVKIPSKSVHMTRYNASLVIRDINHDGVDDFFHSEDNRRAFLWLSTGAGNNYQSYRYLRPDNIDYFELLDVRLLGDSRLALLFNDGLRLTQSPENLAPGPVYPKLGQSILLNGNKEAVLAKFMNLSLYGTYYDHYKQYLSTADLTANLKYHESKMELEVKCSDGHFADINCRNHYLI